MAIEHLFDLMTHLVETGSTGSQSEAIQLRVFTTLHNSFTNPTPSNMDRYDMERIRYFTNLFALSFDRIFFPILVKIIFKFLFFNFQRDSEPTDNFGYSVSAAEHTWSKPESPGMIF